MVTQQKEINRAVIIPGIKGKLGTTYCDAFQTMRGFKTIGLTRQKVSDEYGNLKSLDLRDSRLCQEFVEGLELGDIHKVYLIHAIGPFLFEEYGQPIVDTNHDGIDDTIFRSNVETFYHISQPLINRVLQESKKHQIQLTLCAFGSISDRYSVPFWKSYSRSKNILREFIRSNVGEYVRGVFINISSAEKEEERPFADKTCWLSCREVVNRSMRAILDTGLYWQEIDIFKPNPAYRPDYYFNHDKLREKWLREMNGR